MKKFYYLIIFSGLLLSNCEYATYRTHINVDIDDIQAFNQSGEFSKLFYINTSQILNSINKNIKADKNARMENLQIENMQLVISILPNNTATSLYKIHIKWLGLGGPLGVDESLANFNESRVTVSEAKVAGANVFMLAKGVSVVKEALMTNVANGKSQKFSISVNGIVPAGEVFRGSLKIIIKGSLDAVTCDLVPLGFGGKSECD